MQGEKVVAVLDVDSPELARFDHIDVQYLTEIAALYQRYSDLSGL